uniref:Mechanosensitive ion channel MscS domain-containing protein n=1 Tax=Globisporangium ultimum (strain ATCC 200006 / CBS 805.95 / DAOM BR144) TaxID=431595 RepID=K3WGB1_GLOUD
MAIMVADDSVSALNDDGGNSTSKGLATGSTSNDQWRVFLGLAIFVAAFIFRVELVRFSLRLVRRAVPGMFVWIKEFEKNLLMPLSWVVLILLIWLSMYVMDLSTVLGLEPDTLTSIVTLILGFPLIWVVINFCNYVTWGIIRVKGWNRAASKDDDDYSRVMIITEGIGVIKILLVTAVVSSFMMDGIGNITDFDSSQISTVAVLMVELVFVFGAHSWLKNIMGGLMALLDEQIKGGSHIRFQGHEGVVERLFLQCFALRQYDKGLAYIPNGILLENTVEIQSKSLDRRCEIAVHLSHRTKAVAIRVLIQELDSFLLHLQAEKHHRRKAKVVMGLEKKVNQPRGSWELKQIYGTTSKLLAKTSQDDDDEDLTRGRFWISVEAPYKVHIVYYTQERHIKAIMAEKTEVTDLLAKLKLKLHGEDASAASARALPPKHKMAVLESSNANGNPLSPTTGATLRAPSSLPPNFDRFRRNVSESTTNGMRQRRQQSSML